MKGVLKSLSVGIAGVTLGGALLLAATNDSGGFLPNLGLSLAAMLMALGNGLTFLSNVLLWRLYGVPRWLKGVVVVQALPALACLALVGHWGYREVLASRASAQRMAVFEAIRADDATRLARATSACGKQCADSYPLDERLLDAAYADADRVMVRLVAQSARVRSGLGTPSREMRTCEGLYLPMLDALGVAVAYDDAPMLQLLLPVSDAGSRRSALWLAAQLDRLEMVKRLAKAGVPLDIRGQILDEDQNLLVAAASGGAVQTGRWLIETQHMPVDIACTRGDNGCSNGPLKAWYRFVSETGASPHAAAFLDLLLAHGIRLDDNPAVDALVQDAVRMQRKDLAQLFVDAGFNIARVDESRRQALRSLLAQPDAPYVADTNTEGCIAPASHAPMQ